MQVKTHKPHLPSSFSMGTVAPLLSWAAGKLKVLGKAEARASSERLLGEITGLGRSALYSNPGLRLTARQLLKFKQWVRRRQKREPLAYVTQTAYFRDEVLKVRRGCLIPRPETEILIDKFIEKSQYPRKGRHAFLDLGAGSGAIGLALLREFPESEVTFADISKRALAIVRKNLKRQGFARRAKCYASDFFQAMAGQKWDAILCNPPYLSAGDWRRVAPEIFWEPRRALDGGKDGLAAYRKIIPAARGHLNAGGFIVFEVGIHQAFKVRAELVRAGFQKIQTFKDYGGIERVLIAQK